MIGIVNYRMGNLASVANALRRVGAEAVIVATAAEVMACDKLILPGVGAFGDGMAHLREQGLIEPIRAFAASGRPMLGVCLGMQLFFDSSTEDVDAHGQPVPGLGLLPGRVVAFTGEAYGPGRLKVPHMGWNTISPRRADPLLAGLPPEPSVYFVHGYFPTDVPAEVVLATCDYGGDFCAVAQRGNLWATQFHPEKSQRVGLTLLRQFVEL